MVPPDVSTTSPPGAEAAEASASGEINLLYVEDSRTAQALLRRAVEQIVEFSAATTLAEARQAIAQGSFNFFVLDYELPDGNGLQLAREIRRDPRHKVTPIILYSASLDDEMAYAAMVAGVNLSLQKPMNLLDLRDTIVRLSVVPEIKTVRRKLIQFATVLWQAEGQFHAFSPDLGQTISGPTRESVTEQIQAMLDAFVARDGVAENHKAIEPQVVRHVIALGG